MRKNLTLYLLLLLTALLPACDEDDRIETAADLIESIEAGVWPDNALRVDVKIRFRKEVQYSINYWPTSDPLQVTETSITDASGEHTTTLLFLEPETRYSFTVKAVSGGAQTESDAYNFTTHMLPPDVPEYKLHQNSTEMNIPGYVMLTRMDKPGFITMINSLGKVVWYQNIGKSVKVAGFDPKTNTIVSILGEAPLKTFTGEWIEVIDLYGTTVMSALHPTVYAHHEIRFLPDGDLIMVNFVPRAFDLTAHGGSSNDTIWGPGYTVMDIEGKIKTQWDCYDEMNPMDIPTSINSVANGLPEKPSWLHSNSINYDEEGYLYMTLLFIDQVWKIDPKTGKVIYRAGRNGNIDLPEEAYTSGIHAAEPLGPNKVLLFDNGQKNKITRALIYDINEAEKKGTLELNVSLPIEYFTQYQGSVELIGDDVLIFGSTYSLKIVYTDLEGNILRVINTPHMSYRADYIAEINY